MLIFVVLGVCNGGELSKKFYKKSCPEAEDIVKNITWKHVSTNSVLPAKFLRMHFHDCFVRGCDASVLLDSTANSTAEKEATPNLSLAGFDVIDEIKTQLEKTCPGIVSCADIVALAARDSVSFQFNKSMWEVLTGRRDGRISLASQALNEIPSPFFNFTTLKQSFANKGLTLHDLVVLSGGHTIGVGHCNFFSNRLYNFTGKGDQDPSLNSTYAAFLKTKCTSLADNTTTSDAALLTDKGSRNIVDELVESEKFFTEFGQSMESMGAIGVLTGTSGEIRKKCSVKKIMRARNIVFVFLVSLLVCGVFRVCDAGNGRGRVRVGELRMNFYKNSCPKAEDIVKKITWSRIAKNPGLPAKLLRMHYHDCFVTGCDASILLDTVNSTSPAEKEAIPNLTLFGFDVIEDIKTEIEKVCPGVVSCADILSLSARDAVSFQSNKAKWKVHTGRKDGRVSLASQVTRNLPSPFANFSGLMQVFTIKGLDKHDLVTLSGAHTIGVGRCLSFSRRLYNFTGKGDADLTLNATYADFLRSKCSPNPADQAPTVVMDPPTPSSFDQSYFTILLQNKGLFQSDAALLSNGVSQAAVWRIQRSNSFFTEFVSSMKKLGAIGVLTGTEGEIRKQCHVVN
ncbi:hypothetical protein Dsin_029394 [Dipteronia sinensis]|uniref:peroxidase n=1 Tax=Dipteronia sinensis TaxID=43782 RepID=A0AAE0DV55_9ROSI|nr:hypothetical protein Dsin_029394 [Dipteronia sinensis]